MKLSIRFKIILGSGGILLLMMAITAIGILRVNEISRMLTVINDVNTVKQRYAINFRGSVHDRSIRIRDYVLLDSPSERDSVLGEIRSLKAFYDEAAVSLDSMLAGQTDTSREETDLLAAIKASETETLPVIESIISLEEAGRKEDSRRLLLERARPQFQLWLDRINAYIDFQEANNIELTAQTRAIAQNFQLLMIVICGIALAVGAVLSVWTIMSVVPLNKVADALNDIAAGEGDLTSSIAVRSEDEIGKVAGNFNMFVETLHRIIETVKDSVEGLADTSRGLSASMDATQEALGHINGDISRVQEQMSTQSREVSDVSETIGGISGNIASLNSINEQKTKSGHDRSSAVEQMVASVQSVTDALEKSMAQFSNLTEVSEAGYRKISEVQEKVLDISSKSQGMSEANSVIDSIASQTNLLAMNAAIEAAHAGEAGKGFAVVADEIRKLAENSSMQSKSISSALKELVRSIADVVQTSKTAGQSFEEVRKAIEVVVDEQRRIQCVMDEQSEGNRQVRVSFETIQRLNEEVRAGAAEMYRGSQSILAKTADLVEITSGINTSMSSMTASTQDIEKAVDDVVSLGKTTEEGIRAVKSQIDRFIL